MTMMQEEARLALAAKGAAERDIARMSVCPPWRHAAFAGMETMLVVSPAVPLPVRLALLLLIFAAMPLIIRSDRRRLGVFINGYRRGKTRLVALPMVAAVLLLYSASCYFALARGLPAVSVALAAVTFVVGYAGSIVWQRVFVRELGA